MSSVLRALWLFASMALGSSSAELYDCSIGFDNWQYAWTESWKAYCCVYHQKGCPTTLTQTTTTRTTTTRTTTTETATTTSTLTTTRTATSTTDTSTTKTSTTETATISTTVTATTTSTKTSTETSTSSTTFARESCDQICELGGERITCGERILRAKESVIGPYISQDPCLSAELLVFSDCLGMCGGCSADKAGCSNPNPNQDGAAMYFKKKFEVLAADKVEGADDAEVRKRNCLFATGGFILSLVALALPVGRYRAGGNSRYASLAGGAGSLSDSRSAFVA